MKNLHTISYAYPTSPTAQRFGKSKEGCFVYRSGTRESAFDFESDALLVAKTAGTKPGYGSIDHPSHPFNKT